MHGFQRALSTRPIGSANSDMVNKLVYIWLCVLCNYSMVLRLWHSGRQQINHFNLLECKNENVRVTIHAFESSPKTRIISRKWCKQVYITTTGSLKCFWRLYMDDVKVVLANVAPFHKQITWCNVGRESRLILWSWRNLRNPRCRIFPKELLSTF
jgi:hypothetical protein